MLKERKGKEEKESQTSSKPLIIVTTYVARLAERFLYLKRIVEDPSLSEREKCAILKELTLVRGRIKRWIKIRNSIYNSLLRSVVERGRIKVEVDSIYYYLY